MIKIQKRIFQYWKVLLIVSSCVLMVMNIGTFYPGYLTNDSIDQLLQAQGSKPYDDWHPPLMALQWHILRMLPGSDSSSMLLWQCLLLWSALGMLAIYVYDRTRRRLWSLLPLALGCMPFVVNISGVIWKDVQMAVALALASVGLLIVSRCKGWKRHAITALIGALIVYAVNVRYNALPAVLPLVWLLWRAKLSRRNGVIVVGLVVAVSLLLSPVLYRILPVTKTHPNASIMLDDIVHVYDVNQVKNLKTNRQLHQALVSVVDDCAIKRIPVSVWIGCGDVHDINDITRQQYADMTSVWLHAIVSHPAQYLSYRLSQFMIFLAPRTDAQVYAWQNGTVANSVGIESSVRTPAKIVHGYVEFVLAGFGAVFRPLLWLVAGVLLLVASWRRRQTWPHATFIMSLALSGVLYILAYAPLVASYDFRYTYWSCLAISIAAIIAFIDKSGNITRP